MLFKDVISLIDIENEQDAAGYVTPVEVSRRTVYANKKSVTRAEYYRAAAVGRELNAVFEVRAADYLNEPLIEHCGRAYNVTRTYTKNGELMELICSERGAPRGGIEG